MQIRELLRELFVFYGLIYVFKLGWKYFFFFSIQNVKSNFWIIFLKLFPTIYFWWIIYSFPIIFIYKLVNIWNSFWMWFNFFIIWCNSCCLLKTFINFIFRVYCCFFVFYPVWRINIWTTTLKIRFMTFVIHKLNWIKNEITSSYLSF